MENIVANDQNVYTIDRMFSDFLKRMNEPKKTDNKKPIENIAMSQIYEIEPRIKAVMSEAKKVVNPDWGDYSRYKRKLESLVGYESEKGEICSEEAYDKAIEALCNALRL